MTFSNLACQSGEPWINLFYGHKYIQINMLKKQGVPSLCLMIGNTEFAHVIRWFSPDFFYL
jgi:hypothetical protein